MFKFGLFFLPVITQDDNTDVVRLQVEGHSANATVELDHLSSLDLCQTEYTGNTITNGDDSTKLLQVIL